MKKIATLFLVISTLFLTSCKEEHNNLPDGLYAAIETSKGTIILALDYEKAPELSSVRILGTAGNGIQAEKAHKTFANSDGMKDSLAAAYKGMQSDAPACNVCGHIMMRSGTCYKCNNCGNQGGCI